jgi:hypothetical protein
MNKPFGVFGELSWFAVTPPPKSTSTVKRLTVFTTDMYCCEPEPRMFNNTFTARVFKLMATALCLLISTQSRAQGPAPQVRPAFAVQILPGHSLASDDGTPYVDGTRGVVSFGNYALALCTDGRVCGTLPTRQPEKPSERVLVLDLTSPIVNSGAKDRGVIRASSANMGAFWEQDAGRRGLADGRENLPVRSVLDMGIGRMVESERAEIRFFIDNVQHILQFGPWTAGVYQNTNQAVFHGEGTTRGMITRVSETEWILRSGSKSIGTTLGQS